jgi:MYXO-CTERM domain-containing protein
MIWRVLMLRKMYVFFLTMVLTLSIGLIANAETGGAGNTDGNNVNQGKNNMFRTTAADDGTDWGWLGLLGLAGLAGLAGRNRNPNPER